MAGATCFALLMSMFLFAVSQGANISPPASPNEFSTTSKTTQADVSTSPAATVASTVGVNESTQPTFSTVTSPKASSPPQGLDTSLQTSSPLQQTHPSSASQTPPQTTAGTSQTPNGTTDHGSTLPSPSGKPTNTTQSPPNIGDKNLVSNPGLVAVLCIFCLVVGLLLLVAIIKAVRSRRSNFERLEDVPMDKVNEGSPFAHYPKKQ